MPPTPHRMVRPLAPEDVRADQYVLVLQQIVEIIPPSLLACEEAALPAAAAAARGAAAPPLRFVITPGEPQLFQVLEVCHPIALVMCPQERVQALDLRLMRLGAVTERFGRAAFTALDPSFGGAD